MEIQHKDLAMGRWKEFSFFEQMANIGSEVERALKWREKNNSEYSVLAFERALELLDLTIEDDKNNSRLKELMRLRETLADYFFLIMNTDLRKNPGEIISTLLILRPGCIF